MRPKKALKTISMGIILVLFLATIIEAANLKLRVIAESAEIRMEPNLTSAVIKEAPSGAVLEAVSKKGEWYLINLPPDESGFSVSGYVHQSMVEVIGEEKIPEVKEEKPKGIPPVTKQPEAQKLFDPSNRFKVEGSFSYGGGTKKIELGKTTDGKTISLSPGGGAGVAITLGYNFYSKLYIDLTAGFQFSRLSPNVENADGSFDRSPLLATLKYRIPVVTNAGLKLGGGIGYYASGEWDVDASEVPNGAHNIVKYDGTTGFHIILECEIFAPRKPNVNFTFGAKYYNVSYDANACTSNGISVPVKYLPDELRTLNGSGFDFSLGLGWYF